jgi:hypothetical protein
MHIRDQIRFIEFRSHARRSGRRRRSGRSGLRAAEKVSTLCQGRCTSHPEGGRWYGCRLAETLLSVLRKLGGLVQWRPPAVPSWSCYARRGRRHAAAADTAVALAGACISISAAPGAAAALTLDAAAAGTADAVARA